MENDKFEFKRTYRQTHTTEEVDCEQYDLRIETRICSYCSFNEDKGKMRKKFGIIRCTFPVTTRTHPSGSHYTYVYPPREVNRQGNRYSISCRLCDWCWELESADTDPAEILLRRLFFDHVLNKHTDQ